MMECIGMKKSTEPAEGTSTDRVVLVRALPGLGDFLCAVPAWSALRRGLPKAQIDLVALPETRHLAQRFSQYFDDFIEFPGFPGIVERPARVTALPAFLSEMHERRYDLALQMHGDGSTSNIFSLLLGAKRTVGFYLPSGHCPDPESFLPYPDWLHEVQRNTALVRFLGIEVGDDAGCTYEFSVTDSDEGEYARLAQRHGLQSGRYVCIHPGASRETRRWSPRSFAQVGSMLRAQGLQIVLTGTADEAEITAIVARHLGQPVIDLSGQTSVGALAVLLGHARLLLCNDTGVSHLGAAMKTPSVIIFLTSDLVRWGPMDRSRRRPVGYGNGEPVSTEQVLAATWSLLDGTGQFDIPPDLRTAYTPEVRTT